MIRISEWLPDPGPGSSNQWLELYNDGGAPVNLSGWHLQTTAKKPIPISGVIGGHDYLVLRKVDFKFTLRKTDGQLALLDPVGRAQDFAYFHGQAIRYQSANRAAGGGATFFARPTPGGPNIAEAATLIADHNPFGTPLPGTVPEDSLAGPFLGMLFGTALLLALAVIFVFTNHHDLSELFFGRH